MKNHMFWMLIGCFGIFLVLFLLPVIGFNGTNSLFVFLLIFFVVHLFMLKRFGGDGSHKEQSKNENDHATH